VRGTRATIIGYSEVGQKEAIAGDLESGSEAGALSIIIGPKVSIPGIAAELYFSPELIIAF
jgi:hypothetical protein